MSHQASKRAERTAESACSKYADIIGLSRPESDYPSMPLEDRAAQFAPFAALTGHREAIEHAGAAHEEPT